MLALYTGRVLAARNYQALVQLHRCGATLPVAGAGLAVIYIDGAVCGWLAVAPADPAAAAGGWVSREFEPAVNPLVLLCSLL